MLGIAIGDAFGAAYENLSRKDVRRIFDPTKYSKNPLFNDHIPGTYTDDTQMSIAVAELITSGEEFTPLNLANYFVSAFKRDMRPGYSRYSFQALQESKSGKEFLAKVTQSSEKNGATMRAIPIGVIPEKDKVINYCVVNAETTHHSPSAIASSVAMGLAAHYFFYNVDEAKSVLDFCLEYLNENNFDRKSIEYLNEVLKMENLDLGILLGKEYANVGVPVNGIKTAGVVLFLLKGFSSEKPFEALKEAILLGGDTDTTAALTLGVFTARYGLNQLPEFLTCGLEGGEYGKDFVMSIGEKLGRLAVDK